MIVVTLIAMLVPISLVGWQIVSPPEHVEERVSNEQNIYARLAAWQAVLGSGLDSPFFGIGFGKTRDLLDSTSVRVAGVKNLSSTHNSFLTLFAELGVVGLFTYIGLVGSFVRAGVLPYKRGVHAQARWRGIGVLSILAAHLVPAFFSNIIFSPVVSHIYVFTFFGAVAALCDSPVQIRGSRYGRYTQRVKGQIGNTRAA
jgi:O-antigen ligase